MKGFAIPAHDMGAGQATSYAIQEGNAMGLDTCTEEDEDLPAHDQGARHGKVQKGDSSDNKEEEIGIQNGHVPDEHVCAHRDQLQEQVALDGDGCAGRLQTHNPFSDIGCRTQDAGTARPFYQCMLGSWNSSDFKTDQEVCLVTLASL